MKCFILGTLLFAYFANNLFSQHQNILIGTLRNPNEPAIIIDTRNPDFMMAGSNLDNYYLSSDGGFSWSENRIFSSTLGVWGDPCIVVDTLGNFYFFHLSNPIGPAWIDQIVCQKSYDFGATWNNGTGIGLNGNKAQDKEWAIIDSRTNNIYVTWTQFDEYGSSDPADSSTILFSKSLNQGATWTVPVRINKIAGDCKDSDGTVEGAVPAVGPNGEIYIGWAGPHGVMFDKSTDNGITWLEEDVNVCAIPGGWDFNIPDISRANGLPVTCCDLSYGPNRGTIYINWSDQRNGSDDTDVWLVKSLDGGNSWTEPVRVNDDQFRKQQFFCWMTVDQVTGKLWFVFYDRRNYNDSMTDVFMAVSDDGGETFANFKVSETPFYPDNSIFFGDYTNISATNDIVRPIWTRLSNFELSIHTAIVDPQLVGISTPELLTTPDTEIYPNPFNNSVAFSFNLASESLTSLSFYNSMGQLITKIIDSKILPEGKYVEIVNANASNLKPGFYYFSFTADNIQQKHKIVYSP